MLHKFNIIILSSLFFYSCSFKNSSLNNALELAKENRSELEKVLHHYNEKSRDSLKYKAACFLIENMPKHYSFQDTALIHSYLYELDSIASIYKNFKYETKDSLYTYLIRKYNINELTQIPDIEIISSDYLIKNIDHAFKVWREYKWASHLTFEDFCEYILPYKVFDGQTLDNWKEYCLNSYNQSLENLKYCSLYKNNAYEACKTVNENIRQDVFPRIKTEEHIPIFSISTLLKIPYGTCDEYSNIAQAIMMAKGIPCAIDFTPQWPFRSMGHTWNVLLENTGKIAMFEGANTPPGTPHKKDHKMAKVFRKTYAINKEIQDLHSSEKYIPETFKTLFIKDVTEEYMVPLDITVKLNNKIKSKYAYLAVFDNSDWIPINWGKISGKDINFKKMGKDIVYLPLIYTTRGKEAIANPLLIDALGKVKELSPDTINKQSLKLDRKYPSLPHNYGENLRIIGAKIQAANFPDFRDSITIHSFSEIQNEVIIEKMEKKYQYWRFYSSSYGYSNIAELAFYERDSVSPIYGKIIGTKGSYRTGTKFAREAAFDGDLLTFFDAPIPTDSWVGMDFDYPVDISRITCIMRGDGNNIEIGNEYELVFWFEGKWKSLGKKVATDIYLTYDNCPANALFLLHNLTKGKEERIFTYENNKQIWW